MRTASALDIPTRVDGVLSDRICGCRPAIGVEMEPYRSTNAYIDNDDWVVGRETCDAFRIAQHSCTLVFSFSS